jgi:hypothetical protein
MTTEPNIATDEKEFGLLYQELLKRWNKRRASEMTICLLRTVTLSDSTGVRLMDDLRLDLSLAKSLPITRLPHIWESLRKCAFSLQMLLSFAPSLAWYRQDSRISTPRSTQFRHSLL